VHYLRTDGGAGLLRPVSQPVMKWLRNVYTSRDRRDISMS
jgi:hypothetical protein